MKFLKLHGGRATSKAVQKEIKRLMKSEGATIKDGLVKALGAVARREGQGAATKYVLKAK